MKAYENVHVSVIMSCYNEENNIYNSIQSLTKQTHENFELLIIDDNSTDNTSIIVNDLALIDSRIKFIQNNSNKGLTINLNKLIELSNGKYIFRMDADDICTPTRFEKQIEFLENNPSIDILGTNAQVIDLDGTIQRKVKTMPENHREIIKMLPIINPMIHPSVCFRKTVFENLKYNPKRNKCQDYDLWFALKKNGNVFHNLQLELIQFRESNLKSKRNARHRLTEISVKLAHARSNFPKIIIGLLLSLILLAGSNNFSKKIFLFLDPRRR